MNREELLDLIPAYALDALDVDERVEIEALLKKDAEAQFLLQEYEAVAAILPFAVPHRPAPAHLRADLKARLAKPSPVAEVEKSPSGTAEKSRILPFPTNTIITLAVAMLVMAIGLVAFLMNDSGTTENPNEILYNQLIEQDGSQRFTLTPELASEATGELVYSADGTQAILRISELPDTTEEESYQLWLSDEDAIESGGIFHWADGHGPYYVLIDRPIEDIATVGMTIEPFEGSPENAPTSEQLFNVTVAQAR